MKNLIRLIYASTATKPVDNNSGMVQVDVGRILMQARKHNPTMQIGGVLYFSNNYFFQCLEGDQQAVNELYNKITDDPRHTNVQSLSVKRVSQRQFSNWSMKYIASQNEIQQLIELYGHENFNPYEFSDELIDKMLAVFLISKDPTTAGNKVANKLPNNAVAKRNKSWWPKLFSRRKPQAVPQFP